MTSCCSCFAGLGPPAPRRTRKQSYVGSMKRRVSERSSDLELDYELQDIIGQGAFGVVRKVIEKSTGIKRVMKHCDKEKIADLDGFLLECTIQADLDHPHICKIFEVFQDSLSITIIMEVCRGGDLSDYLSSVGIIEENDARCVFEQIMYAVSYMHSQLFCHRDLKPENFLLRFGDEKEISQRVVKVTDFGFARPIPDEKRMRTVLGTPPYMAPELWQRAYDEKVDVWSGGVILYEILCGTPPFGSVDDESEEIFKRSAQGKLRFSEPEWERVSGHAKLLIHQCLKMNPDERVSAHTVMQSRWFEQQTSSPLSPSRAQRDKSFKRFAERCAKYEQHTDFYKAAAFQIAHSMSDSDRKIFEYRQIFENLDVDKDGGLTIGEMKKGLEQFGFDIETIHDLFEKNGNVPETIQYTQFLEVMMCESRAVTNKEAAWQAFRQFDVDGDRHLDKKELKSMLQRMEHVSDAHVEEVLNEVDTKHQGFIDFDEFMAYMEKVSPSRQVSPQSPTLVLK